MKRFFWNLFWNVIHLILATTWFASTNYSLVSGIRSIAICLTFVISIMLLLVAADGNRSIDAFREAIKKRVPVDSSIIIETRKRNVVYSAISLLTISILCCSVAYSGSPIWGALMLITAIFSVGLQSMARDEQDRYLKQQQEGSK